MLKSDHTMRVVQGRLASTPGGPIRFQRPARTRQPAKSERTAGLLRLGKGPCGGLGRSGWLVIGTFHASLLIGADLYLAGPSVESVRHGGADGHHLIPENNRHSRCDDDGSRDDGHGHGVVHTANMLLRGTQASRIPCHDQTDPTTGGPRCGALAVHPVSRRASHRPEDCSARAATRSRPGARSQ